jgi:hypothetical protein
MKRLACVVFVLLAACAKPPTPAQKAEANQPLFCANRAQCDGAWQRIQVWIATNSRNPIQLATDVLIQTFPPPRSSLDTGFTATRTNNADGSASIGFRAGCDNFIECKPDPVRAILDLKRYALAE